MARRSPRPPDSRFDESAAPDRDPGWVARVRERLVAWYGEWRRDLPWRADRDPYRILVSEMMLVQTTVAAVVPYFGRFLRRFPDGRRPWPGPTRPRCSRPGRGWATTGGPGSSTRRPGRSWRDHGGVFPDDPEAIRALPGVGRYIAGAFLSFAFDRPAPIVEANTQRVLARWLAWRGRPEDARSQARLWEAAGRLVPPEGGRGRSTRRSWSWAPWSARPGARLPGLPGRGRMPGAALGAPGLHCRSPPPKAPPLAVSEACALVDRGGRFLIVKRGPGGLWEDSGSSRRSTSPAPTRPAGRSATPVDLAEGVRRLTGVRARSARSSRPSGSG